MIRRILVALDPGEETPVAVRYAAAIARRYDAEVSGLAVIDTRKIATAVGPGGAVGSAYYAGLSRQRMTEETRARARELVRSFESTLEEEGVRHGERVEEGVVVERVLNDMKYNDLLVIGSTSHFFYIHPEQETPTLAKLVKRGVTPTLVVSTTFGEVERVLLSYDGSPASARTMHWFAYLKPFGTDLTIELAHIRASGSSSERSHSELLLNLAADYLHAHGYDQVVQTSRDGGTPARQLQSHAREIEAEMIVAGAHSVSAVRRLTFGSTTHSLLQECTIPTFLYH